MRDTYIKFGSRQDKDPFGNYLPMIEGDSTDAAHYWWTEVRSGNFALTAAERTGTGEDQEEDEENPEQSRPQLGNVTIEKKVDWGSADLFRLCCEAPEAIRVMSDEEQAQGQIDTVIIEVCRPSGAANEPKIPFFQITYTGVCIVKYQIDVSGPDPSETIEFKYQQAQYRYAELDPYTGTVKEWHNADGLVSFAKQSNAAVQAAASVAASSGGGATSAAVAASSTAAAAAASASAGPAASTGVTSSTDALVAANFSGYLSVTSSGVLPD